MTRIYLRLLVDFDDDADVAKLLRFRRPREARAVRELLTSMWRYCKREKSDGHVPLEVVGKLAYPDTEKVALEDADKLVECGLAERTPTGYYLPGYLKHNKSRAQIEEESAAKAVAGALGGKAKAAQAKQTASTVLAEAQHVAKPRSSHSSENREQSSKDKEQASTTEGGERTETLRAVDATKPTPKSPTDARCTAHAGVADPGPCRGCGRERERLEREIQRDTERAAKAAAELARNCPDCEGTHIVLDADKKPTGRKCTHRRTA